MDIENYKSFLFGQKIQSRKLKIAGQMISNSLYKSVILATFIIMPFLNDMNYRKWAGIYSSKNK